MIKNRLNFINLLVQRKKLGDMHSFHIVTPSPWPLFGAFSALILTGGLVLYMHFFEYGGFLSLLGLTLIVVVMFFWWRDIIRESTFLGYHTTLVQRGLRLGVILFIISELMFFFGFFWAYFHASLSPCTVLGAVWPPIGINVLNPLGVPLLNTVILVSSGVTLTLSHHALCNNNIKVAIYGLIITILLAFEFTAWQLMEYYVSSFYIADGVYGSTFYMATGFHGFHVLVGSTFLVVCLQRLYSGHFLSHRHLGYEAAIWYWHFVDVVWLFLYLFIYLWGSGIASWF